MLASPANFEASLSFGRFCESLAAEWALHAGYGLLNLCAQKHEWIIDGVAYATPDYVRSNFGQQRYLEIKGKTDLRRDGSEKNPAWVWDGVEYHGFDRRAFVRYYKIRQHTNCPVDTLFVECRFHRGLVTFLELADIARCVPLIYCEKTNTVIPWPADRVAELDLGRDERVYFPRSDLREVGTKTFPPGDLALRFDYQLVGDRQLTMPGIAP